ncbi:MAG: hypothetical protein ACK2TV_00550 [Anaerolineales bacterium]
MSLASTAFTGYISIGYEITPQNKNHFLTVFRWARLQRARTIIPRHCVSGTVAVAQPP